MDSRIPKRPVLDWGGRVKRGRAHLPSVATLPNRVNTTSGRAAIYHALRMAGLSAGDEVLVPTYHCPTMVAPLVMLGLQPLFYAVGEHGLPELGGLECDRVRAARCMIVPHYFGLPRSLADVREWCSEHGVVLIEDCAHAFYGMAGDRQVGAWGDYAIASMTKFFPVTEGGLLASITRPLEISPLPNQGIRAELKGVFDMLHMATRCGRMRGMGVVLEGLRGGWWRREAGAVQREPKFSAPEPQGVAISCDMGRVESAPLLSTRVLFNLSSGDDACNTRRQHFERYLNELSNLEGGRFLYPSPISGGAPYAFPLWVDDVERVYRRLRMRGVPVNRWDRLWPDTPVLEGDVGLRWSRHVLQVLCHQSLRDSEVSFVIKEIREAIACQCEEG
ncbi:DegT/DnrJ/EryC1/StrS family aminotransferase [Pseudothauera lacus]|uniref:Uncharacterized protein n=1 Tax=Pseudothauera lacus TaxID=2136175 RepID=A0A2T4IG66_9RHOO|nr:DegT/DnrJ/EryC1/StrS family aminotransferase [Pseudothauera lacus]PTD96779.1 hypothetical protein C8261_08180 [Pseudothauera lacus]